MNKSSAYPVGLFAFNALVLVLWNNMNTSVILLNLLRIALGNSAEWKGEGSVDWKEVIGLARKQGVLAIAFDALEKVPAELRPSKNILLEWFGRVNTMEQVYELYVNTIKGLSAEMGFI